jgi:hypothetical protein
MLNTNNINNVNIVHNKFIEKELLNSFGFGSQLFHILEKRLELLFKYYIVTYNLSQWVCFIKYLRLFIPINKTFKKRRLVYIYFLDLISSYKG